MNQDAGHRWLGYQPAADDRFIAVCSCGWRSPPQGTAGVAGALLDEHRAEARRAPEEPPNAGPEGFPAPSVDASDGGEP